MGKIDWRRVADGATKWCLHELWDGSVSRFRPATPPVSSDLPWDTMWANGIAFSMLVGATRFDRRFYEPYLRAFFVGLNGYWDTANTPPGYDAFLSRPGNSDKYFDDNAWMVITYAEAFDITRDQRYKTRAEETLRYVLSGWDDKKGGIFWREDRQSKNTCSNAPAATGCLALSRFGDAPARIAKARQIVTWTRETLQDPSDGLYWDNVSKDGRIEKTKWTYNTALMIRAHLDLWRYTHDRAQLAEAIRLAEASEKVFVLPETGAFRDDANFSHLLCEAFLMLWQETKIPFLRSRAEACGTFAETQLHDRVDNGYSPSWHPTTGQPSARKSLMANAATARLFWLLAKT